MLLILQWNEPGLAAIRVLPLTVWRGNLPWVPLHTPTTYAKNSRPCSLRPFLSVVLAVSKLEGWGCLPMGQREGLLTACSIMAGSPSLTFLSCNATRFVCKYPSGPICFIPVRMGSGKPTQTCCCFCCNSHFWPSILSRARSVSVKLTSWPVTLQGG